MSWCPECRNEYEARISSCADCGGIPLVPEEPPERAEEGSEPRPFVFTSAADVHRISDLLARAGIPVSPFETLDGREAFTVPTAFLSLAVQGIRETFPDLVLDSQAELIEVRPHDPSLDGIKDHPVLHEPWDNLAARGEAARSELIECLARGTEAVRVRARALLFRFGEQRIGDLARAVRAAAVAGQGAPCVTLLRELAEEAQRRTKPWPGEVLRLLELLAAPDLGAKGWGIEIAERLRMAEAVEPLSRLLLDPDPSLAVHADDALCVITGEDLGFDPTLPRAEIERIAEERRRRAARP